MPTHRFNYESDPTKGGTWFGRHGVRLCDWSWDGEKKTLTIRRGRRAKQIPLSGMDVEKLDSYELGRRLSEAALEAARRFAEDG